MEYRILPHGGEQISVVGLGMGSIHNAPDDEMAAEHYRNLDRHASDCVQCGHCNKRCPFGVDQMARMRDMAAYFGV